jgi:uncharacterized membrane protein (DUF2068 family)
MPRSSSSVLSQRGSGNAKSPPLGIKIYCVLGVVGLIVLAIRIPLLAGLIPGVGGLVAALLATLIGVVHAVSLVGLWRVVSWGWLLAVVIQGFSLVYSVIGGSVPSLLVSGLILAYLFLVREHYMD